MKPRYVALAALAATSLYALAGETLEKLPAPWFITGDAAKSYEAGIDNGNTPSGKGAKMLRHVSGDGKGFGSLMQQIAADKYRGQRIRFQAQVKAADVSNWAGLWMRVDTPDKHARTFYNSQDKPIKGSAGWQLRSVVLNVPADATAISFGVIDAGTGTVWIDALTLEVVGEDVPVDVFATHAKPLPDTPTL